MFIIYFNISLNMLYDIILFIFINKLWYINFKIYTVCKLILFISSSRIKNPL